MAALIAYFSRADENYFCGQLKTIPVGNTELAARTIHGLTGAPLFKIEMKHPTPPITTPASPRPRRTRRRTPGRN